MRKKILPALISLFIFLIIGHPVFAQTKSVSRNRVDSIKITRITPRTLTQLLKPVNMPINMEIEYNLRSEKTGKVVITAYKFKAGRLDEVSDLRRVYRVNKGKKTIRHTTPILKIPKKDNTIFVYVVASLVGSRGKELAFSSSKEIVSGSYKIFESNSKPTGNYIRLISISPKTGSDIKTETPTEFDIVLNYSVRRVDIAYVTVVFCRPAELGTGRNWKSATVAVPGGKGKIRLKPLVNFPKNLAGKNMAMSITLWLEPLKGSEDYIWIRDYFLSMPK